MLDPDKYVVRTLSKEEAAISTAEAEMVRTLAGTYKPEDIVRWLDVPHGSLDGDSPRQRLTKGEYDEMIEYTRRLMNGDPA